METEKQTEMETGEVIREQEQVFLRQRAGRSIRPGLNEAKRFALTMTDNDRETDRSDSGRRDRSDR